MDSERLAFSNFILDNMATLNDPSLTLKQIAELEVKVNAITTTEGFLKDNCLTQYISRIKGEIIGRNKGSLVYYSFILNNLNALNNPNLTLEQITELEVEVNAITISEGLPKDNSLTQCIARMKEELSNKNRKLTIRSSLSKPLPPVSRVVTVEGLRELGAAIAKSQEQTSELNTRSATSDAGKVIAKY